MIRSKWLRVLLANSLIVFSVGCMPAEGDRSKIFDAIRMGKKTEIEAWLRRSPDPNQRNAYGDTVLIWAVFQKNKPLIKTLIDLGADLDIKGSYEKTALHWAAKQGDRDVCTWLVEAGALGVKRRPSG